MRRPSHAIADPGAGPGAARPGPRLGPIDPRDPDQRERLRAMLEAAQRIEEALVGPAEEPPGPLLPEGETCFGAWMDDQLCGAIYLQSGDGLVEITRLLVDPARGGQGVGGALVAFALAGHPGQAFKVATAAGNLPALRLYRRCGFQPILTRTSPGGTEVVLLARLN